MLSRALSVNLIERIYQRLVQLHGLRELQVYAALIVYTIECSNLIVQCGWL